MKKKRAWIWRIGRILLALVLLAIVFKVTVKLSDTVHLADGTQVRGTIRSFSDSDIVIESDGSRTSYPLGDLAVHKGEPWVEQGLVSLVKRLNVKLYLYGVLLLGIAPFVASWRWRMLLGAQQIHISNGKAVELTFLGLFFNNFMPGLTGGDVVKAYYAARLTHTKKPHAVVTVFLDRVIGIVALGIVAGAAIILAFFGARKMGGTEYQRAAWFVLFFILASAGSAIGFYSRRLRRVLADLVRRMPGYTRLRGNKLAARAVGLIRHVDSALFLYRYHKGVLAVTMAVSFVAHTSAIVAIYCFGRALGITQAGLVDYFVVVPVCFIISSVPGPPGGWGVGEAVFMVLFGAVGVPGTAAVTMSVIYRISQAIWTIPGGVVMMFQRDKASVQQVEQELRLEEDLPGESGDGDAG